jgi:hypothetical protein
MKRPLCQGVFVRSLDVYGCRAARVAVGTDPFPSLSIRSFNASVVFDDKGTSCLSIDYPRWLTWPGGLVWVKAPFCVRRGRWRRHLASDLERPMRPRSPGPRASRAQPPSKSGAPFSRVPNRTRTSKTYDSAGTRAGRRASRRRTAALRMAAASSSAVCARTARPRALA